MYTLTAANIVANENVNINAARNLTVQSGQDTAANENHSDNKAIGSVRISDTERFWGYHTEKHNDNGANVTQVSSNIASLGGNVNLKAGEKYTQTASNVMAANDINVTAKSIELLTADNTGVHHDDDKSLKVGVFARVTSPLIDLVNNVDAARKSDDRLAAMQGMAAGANAYQAASAASALVGGPGSGTLAKAEVGVGVASAKSRNDSQYQISQGSSISAGGNLNLTSTEGDIHGVQATLAAGKTLTLDSANNILLEAGESHTESSGKNSNWGVEVGVGVQVGAQTGAYAYATANVGKGKYETSSTTYSNTHLTGETINIKSKGDTTLKGADATANTINADVGGKLAIESLQDTAEQHMKQTNAGVRVQVSLGNAWEASGSISQSKANGTYTGVNQQSGLFAGDGGYHVKADTVDLKGGAITSTNAANSELTANAITFSNLENKMEFEADSASMSGGFGGSGGPNISPGMPMSESGSDSSTTRATLTEGKITIGGQSTTAAATGINTDAAAAHNTIDKLPDLQVLLKDQQAMAAAASTVISTVKQASSDIAKEAERQNRTDKTVLGFAKEDLEAAEATKDPVKIAAAQANYDSALKTYNASAEAAKNWGKGGDYSRALDVVTGIIVGGVAGQGGTQIAANAAAPYAAEAIGDYFDDHPNQTAQILSHAVLGAALAYANGGSVAGGAAAGAAGEAAAIYLTQELYGDDPKAIDPLTGQFNPKLLSEEQKQNIVALSTAVGALVSGTAGDSLYDAATGGNVAENAATNNLFAAETQRSTWLRDKVTTLLNSADPEGLQRFFEMARNTEDYPLSAESEARLMRQAENNLAEVKVFANWATSNCGGMDAAGCRSAYNQNRIENGLTALSLVIPVERLVALGVKMVRGVVVTEKAAVLTRAELKAAIFANRNGSELKALFKWGNGMDDALAAYSNVNSAYIANIKALASKDYVVMVRDFYTAAMREGRGGATAPMRIKLMDEILKNW